MILDRPTALIFDMDGLIIDSEPMWRRVEQVLADEHGIAWTDEHSIETIGRGLENLIVTMRREAGLKMDVDEGVRWLVDAFIARIDDLELKPGFVELHAAARAAGLRLALASSNTTRLIGAVLDRFSLRDAFDAVVSGQDVAHSKPAPDIFLRAAELLAVAPRDSVVVEDSLAGVEAARAAGMAVIAVPEQAHDQFPALTPHVAADLHEAQRMLGL